MALLPDAPSTSRQPSPFRAQPPLTPVQAEILQALEGEPHATHVQDRPEPVSPTFWRIGLGVTGIVSLAVGTVAVFFFTIFGAILLFAGSAACVYALQAAARAPDESDYR